MNRGLGSQRPGLELRFMDCCGVHGQAASASLLQNGYNATDLTDAVKTGKPVYAKRNPHPDT